MFSRTKHTVRVEISDDVKQALAAHWMETFKRWNHSWQKS